MALPAEMEFHISNQINSEHLYYIYTYFIRELHAFYSVTSNSLYFSFLHDLVHNFKCVLGELIIIANCCLCSITHREAISYVFLKADLYLTS